jgi:hypothetical protein
MGSNLGLAQHFFKTNEKRLNSGRILSRAQNWAGKQAQLSEKKFAWAALIKLLYNFPQPT